MGSCFSKNIGEKFKFYKFQSLINPFGILYHPLAIKNMLDRLEEAKPFTADDLFFHNERWHSFKSHSILSHTELPLALEQLNTSLKAAHSFLQSASHIIITLGTAWYYHHLKTNQTVANCHKVPQTAFEKRLQSVKSITETLGAIEQSIKTVNPNVHNIFTISPVRHLRAGFTENQRSKAHLIAGLQDFLSKEASNVNCNAAYFPAYEIMMDELRDYRFYADDLLHPNALAIEYIWERFRKVWISGSAKEIMSEVESIQKGLLHRPFNPQSKAHQIFIDQLQKRIVDLKKQYPYMSFDA